MIGADNRDRIRIKREKRFWDIISSVYDKFISEEADKDYRALLDRIAGDIRKDDIVLDVATGTGIAAFKMAGIAREVYGIDISPKMIKEAEKKQKDKSVENIKFILGDGYNMPFKDNMFDVVICCNVLHMMKDPYLSLVEMKRVLKSKGVLIAPTYCHAEPTSIMMKILLNGLRFFRWIGLLPYLHRFNKKDILKIIRGSGFNIVEHDEIGNKPAFLYIKALKDINSRSIL